MPLRQSVAQFTVVRNDSANEWARLGATAGGPMSLEGSVNAGRSWSRIQPPCRASADESPMSIPTTRRDWVVCTNWPGAGMQGKQLFESEDGGRTWHRLLAVRMSGRPRSSHTGGIDSFGYPSGLSMTADGVGILTEDRGMSYATSDGGRHWRPLRSITAPDTREGIAATQVSATTAFVLVFSGDTGTTLYRSTDGDRHWTPVQRWPPR
jgi:photosystem II stability/assembly factor-like uncharacterized protein